VVPDGRLRRLCTLRAERKWHADSRGWPDLATKWRLPRVLRNVYDLLRRNPRPIRDALVIVGILRGVTYYTVQERHPWTYLGIDARAYWGVDLAHPYATTVFSAPSAYQYSPAFAQVLSPLSAIPFPAFYFLWALASYLVLGWLVRPWPWAIPIFFLPITAELMNGQVHLFIAGAIVLAFSRPGALALPILTKITPGISLLWFAIRREWRHLAEAAGFTLAIVLISFALWPTAWFDWYAFLRSSSGSSEPTLIARIAIAIVLIAFGALTDRRWLVPVAIWIALPRVWASSWVILLAVIRLLPQAETTSTSVPLPERTTHA
jgi:hypothetical protein